MKTVRVRFFAAFREAAGTKTGVISTDAATTGELFAELAARFEGLQRPPASLVAVNDRMVNWDSAIAEGDEVLFFPPVSGG